MFYFFYNPHIIIVDIIINFAEPFENTLKASWLFTPKYFTDILRTRTVSYITTEKLSNWGNLALIQGLPGGAVVENPPANAGGMGSIPGPGRSHMPRSN